MAKKLSSSYLTRRCTRQARDRGVRRLMKHLLLLIFWLLSILPVKAANLPGWADPEAAALYAKAALIEWSNRSAQPLDRGCLEVRPLVQARASETGDRIVQVVYRAASGSYVVILLVNSGGFLEVFGRSSTSDSPEVLSARFDDEAFDPSSLLEEG